MKCKTMKHGSIGLQCMMLADVYKRQLPLRLESASVSAQENKRNLLLTIDVQAAIDRKSVVQGKSVGYSGSENFAKGHRFGFFPAYSLAWNIAEESFIKKNWKWMGTVSYTHLDVYKRQYNETSRWFKRNISYL